MRFTKTRRAVAILLLFALLFSTFPISAFANDTGQAEETNAAEETAITDTATELPPEETKASETETAALQASEETEALNATTETTENEISEAVSEPVQIEQENKTEAREVTPADESVEADNGPGKDGLYTDTEGNLFYLLSNSNGTRALMRIYKRYWGYVDFSGPGSHGNFPYLATSLGFTNQTDFGTDGDWVYCIQFNQSSAEGYDDSDSEDLSQSSYWNSLADYQKNGILLAASYGAQNGNGHNTIYDYMATQLIIWEYQLGWRTSATTTTSSYYNMISSGWSYIREEYYRILSDIGKAEKKPTFNTYSHTFDQTGTSFDFEDTNAALSQGAWTIANIPSELSASIVGNKLRVSANSYFTGTRTVTLKRDIPGSAKNAFVYKTGLQHAITGTDNTTITVTLEINAVKSVKIKKTSSASASAMACIHGNPRYSLSGAIYEIRQGSATGPVVATLTTNANGEATSSQTFVVGTELYAKEITAPPGYQLNPTVVHLTVSSDDTKNIFNVSDEPTFDPARLGIMKTGTDSERIAGTIFKADFYASTWMDANYLQRTWYLKSDSTGLVQFDDAHLLSSYGGNSSDELFKPNGPNNRPSFPLGCVYIQEIQAADGYITPVGNDAGVLIFIDPDSSGKAVAYWGDAAGRPITTQNPRGIYKMETDSDGTVITATNQPVYGAPFSVKKIDPSDVPLENAIFRVEYFDAASVTGSATASRTWYFCTAADGFFTLDAAHLVTTSEYPSDELYPTDKIPLGIMRVQELQAPTGFTKNGFVGYWRMKQESSGSSTVLSYWAAADGDTPATGYGDDAYILDADPTLLYVRNRPINELEIVKTSSNGRIDGINFTVERYNPDTGKWVSLGTSKYFTTDTNGKINISNLTVGTRLRVTEIVPDGSICLSENPQILTLTAGKNTVNFENVDISLEIVKNATDGHNSGIPFEVEKKNGESWTMLGTYTTGLDGKIAIETQHLAVGAQIRIKEIVPANYICVGQNPKIVTLTAGKNTVEFINKPSGDLEIIKTSTDGQVEGIGFLVEIFDRESETWNLIRSQLGELWITDSTGKIHIPGIEVGSRLRISEDVPANYICLSENPQIITIVQGTNAVSFENQPLDGSISVFKENADGTPMQGVKFILEYSVDSGASWAPVQQRSSDDPIQTGFCTSANIVNGCITTGEDGSAVFTGLAISTELNHVTYRLTEIKTQNGQSLLAAPVFEGSLTADQRDLTFYAVNASTFRLPMTGSSGFTTAAIGSALALLMALVVLLNLPKKREDNP